MKHRLGPADYRFIAICVALLAGTVWFSTRNFYRAFPEASIDFRVNRDQGRVLAEQFLFGRGYRTEGYRVASSFSVDDEAKIFLEREVGLEQANQIMDARVHVWYWAYRWFRPQQKEEFRVDYSPRGELVGFLHSIPEEAARPETGTDAARGIAEDFLRTRLKRDLARLEFVEVSEISRPRRVDRLFTWKERDFDLHDATYRLEIRVLGNEAGGYREYLKIPEQWKRDYQRLRSKNEAAQLVDSALLVLMVVGLVAVLVMRVRGHDVHWRHAAMVGVIAMVLSFCSSLNEFSLQEFNYPTTDSYGSFFSRQMLQAIVAALGWGGFLFLLTAAAEPLYREAFPDKISLGNLFTLRALRTKRFFLGSILGITLTGIFIAYQTAFYIVAYKFGAWSPADVPYSDLLNTRFPWLFVLLGGFLPAVSEEFLFRMFAIPFLRKLVRSMAIAVVLAGFLWGFGHSGYPQQPFYIRGVEVGIGGVALGLIMLRWGILPTLVWHYSVDAMYSAMLLIRSQSLYFRLSGAASAGVIVLPLVIAFIAYLRHGGFAPDTGLANADEAATAETPPEVAPAPATPDVEARPLGMKFRFVAVALFILGLVALLIPVSRFGQSPVYKIPDEQARAAAEAFLRTQGIDPDAFRHVTFPYSVWSGNDSLAGKYFLERRPVAEASRMFEQYRPLRVWANRYFKSLDQEEVTVAVHPETARILAFDHTIPEDRPGADIAPEQARAVASQYARAQGWDLSVMELKEESSARKKARRDHTLEWEARPGDPRNLDEARFRLHAEVAGDRVSEFRSYWKIPESYSRARSQQNFISIAVMTLRVTVIAGAVVVGILMLVQNIRKGLVPWRRVLRIAGPAALLTAVGPLLSMRLLLEGYNTAIPLETYQAMTYVIVAMSALFAFLMLGGSVALLTSYFPASVAALRAANRRLLAIDALIALMAAAGLALLFYQSEAALQARFHAQALFSVSAPDLIVSAAPAVAAVAGAVRSTIMNAALIAIAALFLQRLLPKPWAPVLLGILAAFASLPPGIHTLGEFALQYGLALAGAACALVFCFQFAGRNYLAYAVVLWVLSLRGPLADLFGNPIPALQAQAWMVVAALVASIVWLVYPALAGSSRTPAAPGL